MNLGLPYSESSHKELLIEIIVEMEESSEFIDELDAHYGFYLRSDIFACKSLFLAGNIQLNDTVIR